MKFTKLYFTREDLKEKLGIESHQFAIAEVKSTVDEVELLLAIDDDAITKGEIKAGKIETSSHNLRRFPLIDGTVATYNFEEDTIKVTDKHGKVVFETSKDGEVNFSGEMHVHETDTNKEVDAVSEALDKVEKVFNIVFNVSERSNKSASELADEIAKTIRTKGTW